jgi:glycosyltransferase involved in cell wall biosynthesis
VVGRVGEAARAAAAAAGVEVEWTGYLPHLEAVAEMRSADVLLLSTEPQDAEAGHITGKLYEYLASGVPVLGLGAPDGDAAALLAEAGAGRMLARDDAEGALDFLRQARRAVAAGAPLAGASREAAAPFSRAAQAARLADLVRSIASRAA